jgi:peptidoglycan hydrolase CwlO-like protein
VALVAAVATGAVPQALGAPGTVAGQRSGVRALEAEVASLDAQTGTALSAERDATRRLAVARAQVRANALELRRVRADHRLAQRRLAARLVTIYRRPPPGFVDILLSSGGLTDALDATRALRQLGQRDGDIVRQLDATRVHTVRLRLALLAERRAVQDARDVAAARRQRLQALATRQRGVLVRSQRVLNALIAQEARRRAAAARAARLAALRDARARLDQRLAAQTTAGTAVPATGTAPSRGTLEAIAQCESGGDPTAVSAAGRYRGKYQFDPGTWRSLGGTGDPAAAPEAVQDRIAARLYAQRGSAPWPICGR